MVVLLAADDGLDLERMKYGRDIVIYRYIRRSFNPCYHCFCVLLAVHDDDELFV